MLFRRIADSLTFPPARVVERRVDGVGLGHRLVPVDREVDGQRRRIVVAKVGIDAIGDVLLEGPLALHPDVVAPSVWISRRGTTHDIDLFRVSRSIDNESCFKRSKIKQTWL